MSALDRAAVGLGAALAPHLRGAGRRPEDAELLEERLADFCRHHGLAVDERAGALVVTAPADRLDGALVGTFVADHLPTHVSLPVRRLSRVARLLATALSEAGARGAIDAAVAEERARTCRRAAAQLPRLDRFARALARHVAGERPGRDLYRADPDAYAAAMRRWELSRPVADEEVEGGFTVVGAERGALQLAHAGTGRAIEVEVPGDVLAEAREGDRVDALVGRNRERWFFLESFAIARPWASSGRTPPA
jgi:hypothetical protein